MSTNVSLSGTFTISILTRLIPTQNTRTIFGHTTENCKLGTSIGKLFIRIVNAGSSDISVSQPTDNQFHTITLTRDVFDKIDIYIDGSSPIRLFTNLAQTGTFNINQLFSSTGASAVGSSSLDAIIMTRVLSASEVSDLHTSRNLTQTNLQLRYPLQEGAGTTAFDVSGNGNNGTITGATYSSDVPSLKRQTVGGNMVRNGDFEYSPPSASAMTVSTNALWYDGTAGGSTTNSLFRWGQVRAGTGSTSLQIDSTTFRTGTKSLKVSITSANVSMVGTTLPIVSIANLLSVGIPARPNTSYTLNYYMKTNYVSGDSTGAYMQLQERNASGGTTIATSGTAIKTTTDWTLYTITATTSSTTAYIDLQCRILGNTGASTLIMDAWFDDITLNETVQVGRVMAQNMKASLSLTGTARVDMGTLGNPQPAATSAFTIAGWIKTAQKNGTIYGGRDSVNANPICTFTIGYNDVNNTGTGKLGIVVRDDAGVGLTAIGATSKVVSDGQWHFVAVTRTSAKLITLYVDGQADGTVTDGMTSGVTINSRRLGNAIQGTTNQFIGLMSDFIQTNTALSATEMATLYRTGVTPDGTIMRLRLQEGAGTQAYDTSGNANDGIITGATFSTDTPSKKRTAVNGNLVKNGDFEYVPPFIAAQTADGWVDGSAAGSASNTLFGWFRQTTGGSNKTAQFDNTIKFSGTNSIKLSMLTTADSGYLYSNNPNSRQVRLAFPCLPGVSYTLKGMIKTTTAVNSNIRLNECNGLDQFITGTNSASVTGTSDWVERTVTLTTGATTRFLEVQLIATGGAIQDTWFDDITLTPTTPVARTLA